MKKTFLLLFIIYFSLPVLYVRAQEEGRWTDISSGVTNDLNGIACTDESTCYAVGGAPYIGGNGIILKTANGGNTWTRLTIPLANPLRDVSCPTTDICYAAGDGGALLKTINGGASWMRLAQGMPAAAQYYWSVAASDASNATAVGNAGAIYRTTNGGANWTRIDARTSENLFSVHFANAAIGWIVGSGGAVLKTINGGASWLPLDTPPGTNGLFDVFSRDGTHIWVGGDVGRILKSTNGGLDWTILRLDTFSTYRAVEFIDGSSGWAAGSGTIKHTTDGGLNWTNEFSRVGAAIRSLVCPGVSVCYAVGDGGMILRRGFAAETESTSVGQQHFTPQNIRQIARAFGRLFNDNLNIQQKQIAESSSKRNSATKRLRGLSVNPSILNQNSILLNLFDDKELIGELKQREERSGGTKVWKGNLEGKPENKITLVSKGNVTVGNIHAEEGVYEIRHAGNGISFVRLIDPNLLPNDLHPKAPRPRTTARATPPPPSEAVAFADAMILITPDAFEDLGGDIDAAGALVELMVEEANQAYQLSNIGLRLRLVRAAVLNDFVYNDSGDLSTDLSQLSAQRPVDIGNHLAPYIWDRRDEFNADLVTLVVKDGGGSCGIAYQMNEENKNSFGELAYSVVDIDCISNYTYPHELGHNMGAQHDRNNADNPPRYSYSYGYQDPQNRFRTVMAYPCRSGECTRIPFFSSPDILYRGVPFGTVNEDNARTLRNTRFIVARYYETSGSGDASANASSDAAAELARTSGARLETAPPAGFRLFLRSFNRGLQSILTLNIQKRAELKLRFANESLIEARQFAAVGKEKASEGRLEQFRKNLDDAEALIKKVNEKNKDNGAKLQEKLIDNQLRQQTLLRTLEKEAATAAQEKIRELRAKEADRMARTVKDLDPDKLKQVLEKAESSSLPPLERVVEQVPVPARKVIEETQKKLKESKEMLRQTEKIKEEILKSENVIKEPLKPKEKTDKIETPCTQEYQPVCGVDGNTYSSRCVAETQNKVKIAYNGECKLPKEEKIIMPTKTPESIKTSESISPIEPVCPKDYLPVCGADNITYQNSCFAKQSRINIQYSGECKTIAPAPTKVNTVETPSTAIDTKSYQQDQLGQTTVVSPKTSCSEANPVLVADITDFSKIQKITAPGSPSSEGPKGHSFIWTNGERIPVYAPVAAIFDSGSYSKDAADSPAQYLLFFRIKNSCNFQFKFDHIDEPVAAIKTVLPLTPKIADSRTTSVSGTIEFQAGDLIGYTRGTYKAGNWDFGLYNTAKEGILAQYGSYGIHRNSVCWPDFYSPEKVKQYRGLLEGPKLVCSF